MAFVKCVQIKANLKNENPAYRLCPNTEFSNGSWVMAISTVACESVKELFMFCNISTNFSVSQRYSKNGQLEMYQQPLTTFLLKVNKQTPKVFNRLTYPGTQNLTFLF